MTETEITVHNCAKLLEIQKVNNESQGQAWCIVHDLCIQLGMPKFPEDQEFNGIQKVVKFITSLKSERDLLKEMVKLGSEIIEDCHRYGGANLVNGEFEKFAALKSKMKQ